MLSANRFSVRTFVVAAIAFAGLRAMMCGNHSTSSSTGFSCDDIPASMLLRFSDGVI